MVFITACMGGGTGTGAAPSWPTSPKEQDILTVGVVTKPFRFEGSRRMKQAEGGIAELRNKVDSLVIIPNERLKLASDTKITMQNAFEIADDVLQQAVQSISDLIKNTGFINLDFADVSAVMKDAGRAHMGVGRAIARTRRRRPPRWPFPAPCWRPPSTGPGACSSTSPARWTSGWRRWRPPPTWCRRPPTQTPTSSSARPLATAEDELRVTVIATGFDEKDEPAAMGAKPFSASTLKGGGAAARRLPAAQYQTQALPPRLPSRRRPPSATTTGTSWSASLAASAETAPNSIKGSYSPGAKVQPRSGAVFPAEGGTRCWSICP